VNQYRDISDGKAAFDEERDRDTFETVFINKPLAFRLIVEGVTFGPTRVKKLHIQGRHKSLPVHPFDFEEGVAEVLGKLGTNDGALTVRWSEFGRIKDVRFEAAA
jgi:hypothetical protein